MKYATVCSGIEACSVAWHPLGWQPQFFSEIEPFPSAVLAHHYPTVPNLGDMTKFKEWPDYELDLICGGTPCQSFSVAGLRKGMADPRGNLALTFLAIVDRYRPTWLVWENVPGVLSSNGGRDFGAILGGMVELGYGVAYRVLDAQYFGVAQRRRRVFVVGCLGDWRRAAAVLFERHSLSGHPAPSRQTGKGFAATTAPSLTASGRGVERAGETRGQDPVVATFDRQSSGEYGTAPVASTVSARDYKGVSDIVTHSLRGEGFDASEDGTGRGTPLVPVVAFHPTQDPISSSDGSIHAMGTGSKGGCATMAVALRGREGGATAELSEVPSALRASGGDKAHVLNAMQVRRLTPRECERLQGFQDDYTLIPIGKRNKKAEQKELSEYAAATQQDNIKWSADGPRYKALGNSMAVPVMHWIGKRIAQVDAID